MSDDQEGSEATIVSAETTVSDVEKKADQPVIDNLGRAYATGKRKNAIARVWIKSGTGKMIINKKEHQKYFARRASQLLLAQPFQATNRSDQYDVFANVNGGGLMGQAGALRHAIGKALALFEPELRPSLRKQGFLTRDARIVERKKYGRRKARRSFQFSKR